MTNLLNQDKKRRLKAIRNARKRLEPTLADDIKDSLIAWAIVIAIILIFIGLAKLF